MPSTEPDHRRLYKPEIPERAVRGRSGSRFIQGWYSMNTVIGIDTGGTCTDAVLYDMESGRVLDSHKALTTHAHLTDGILAALDGLDAGRCHFIVRMVPYRNRVSLQES